MDREIWILFFIFVLGSRRNNFTRKKLFINNFGSGGGGVRQAHQIVSRCLKFVKFCCEDDEDLTFEIVDFSLCSPNLLFKFVGMMQDEWNLGHAGRIGYLDAIAELGDFRKVNGASESVLRGLSCTELYLKKVRKTVSKMMRLQWTSELDIDALVEMMNKAKTNGGFIDQKMFKSAGKYGFDSLYLTETSMQVLDGYINHICPLLKPSCAYVLVTRNGGQHNKLGELVSKLVFDATGKYVHPTRYRQIVETASTRHLSSTAQSTITEDQKHSSVVARVHYQKQRSREVASKCLEKLHGDRGTELEMEVRSRLSDKSTSSQD